jgi:hypothetical protein
MIRWTAPIAFLAAMFITPTATATLVIDMDLPALTSEATHVVHADVLSTRTVDANGQFTTEVQLAVRDMLKRTSGLANGAKLTIELPGGIVGDLAQMVPGAPQLQEGDEVVLFLWQRNAETRPRILGLAQGAWKVIRTLHNAEARRDRRGIGLVNPTTRAIQERRPPSELDRIDLHVLLHRIRTHASKGDVPR